MGRLPDRKGPGWGKNSYYWVNDEMTLDLWRLASDLSVENAVILIAGGDPNATDVKECHFSGETLNRAGFSGGSDS